MYAQVCTRPDIAFAIRILGRFQSNLGIEHRKAAKKVMRYLQDIECETKQTLIATSTMEVEFVTYFEATKHGVWMRNFMSRLRVVDFISRPLKIFCDNSAAIFLAKNNKSSSRNKHIDIQFLAIKKRIKGKEITIEHIGTELMIADPLTKGMPPLRFKDLVIEMGLSSIL
ncbi:hypothetical protein Nepgr_010283 [Nepenthes gracilis]|uniref:Copia protein n=1 Tax=Nepenthes gracilis TaxID=150966 RepID=A0AAD3XKW6_NEPGR|nr:hypothetical protein Nepgr_010283 [Nepenthes gracilis]